VTWRPSRPPAALTPVAQALTAFTDFWKRPGETVVSTSAIRPILMVVAVSPMSVPGPAEPDGAADADPAAAELAGAVPAADPVVELLELQAAASRTAASAAIIPRRRTRARTGRLPAAPALWLLAVTLCFLYDVIACGIARERRGVAPGRARDRIGRDVT
jgi:hypothetical protein